MEHQDLRMASTTAVSQRTIYGPYLSPLTSSYLVGQRAPSGVPDQGELLIYCQRMNQSWTSTSVEACMLLIYFSVVASHFSLGARLAG